jgi:hypothetical protein
MNVLNVAIRINNITYDNSLAADLHIDRQSLDEEFVQHASRYAYYAFLSELAADQEVRLKHALDLLEAQLDSETRELARGAQLADAKFKMTETMVENQVRGNSRYQAKLTEYLDAKQRAAVLRVARESMQQRKDMLVSLGAQFRFLNGSEPRALQREQADHVKNVVLNKAPVAEVQAPPAEVPVVNAEVTTPPLRRNPTKK